jgi:hypothetical protein
MTTSDPEVRELVFKLEFDKMDLYKMAMAGKDVAGTSTIITKLKDREKYIRKVV